MKKQGHVLRTWRRRYFVMDMGMIQYFDKKGASANQGDGYKGRLYLAGCEVRWTPNTDRLYITASEGARDLLLQTESIDDAEEWEAAILRHIDYASKYKQLAAESSADFHD